MARDWSRLVLILGWVSVALSLCLAMPGCASAQGATSRLMCCLNAVAIKLVAQRDVLAKAMRPQYQWVMAVGSGPAQFYLAGLRSGLAALLLLGLWCVLEFILPMHCLPVFRCVLSGYFLKTLARWLNEFSPAEDFLCRYGLHQRLCEGDPRRRLCRRCVGQDVIGRFGAASSRATRIPGFLALRWIRCKPSTGPYVH